MERSTTIGKPASTPEEALGRLADAFNAADLEAAGAAFEPDGTLVPLEGEPVSGREAVKDGLAPLFALEPDFSTEVTKVLEADGVALLYAHWHIDGTDPGGESVSMEGRGNIVVRRQQDGGWLIAIDNPGAHRYET
jgi:uncharacterized protein (TIGR02246 family)